MAAWHEEFKDRGLVIIGNHAPEFSYERKLENVRQALQKLGVHYPVSLDNEFANWNAYRNRYWPTKYLVDKTGVIRHIRIGEGGYFRTRRMIEILLEEEYEG